MQLEYFPDEKVLLVHGRDREVIARVRDQCARLAAEQIACVAIHELPGMRTVAGCQLFAEVGTWDVGTEQDREAMQVFRCRLRPIVWHNVEGLLEPFAQGEAAGSSHQYLDERGSIALIISDGRGW